MSVTGTAGAGDICLLLSFSPLQHPLLSLLHASGWQVDNNISVSEKKLLLGAGLHRLIEAEHCSHMHGDSVKSFYCRLQESPHRIEITLHAKA